jgi:acetylornithine deacetylase
MNYGTDIPNFKADVTRYLYGPGSITVAHRPDEALTVGELEASVEGYQRLVLHILEGS